ncbi:MAG: aldehyde dehydrogenase family protein, partial [Gordonia sp. (in: high G+C Gram-positive bacteria)]
MAETLFIDGVWRAAADRRTREIECPADGSVVAVVAEGGRDDAEEAVAAARRAFDSGPWPAAPAGADRGNYLLM